MLRVMASKMKIKGDFDFNQLAKKTPGFVGADLSALTKEAAIVAINRIFCTPPYVLSSNRLSEEEMKPLFVEFDDFLQALPLVQPSAKREGA